ncbi:ABC transporter [[Mycobacterium] wendilense]|uniref:ArnT family glycosyltransferase n=1 Tax=[Mycobacterium] wendilense TaxID=3064284 RepID=UPI00292DC8EC|nr:ABC transporter [Mycolicibacterium sp. MU0050]
MLRGLSRRRLLLLVFLFSAAGYVAVGYWLQVRHGFIYGDTLARVTAAQSVLFSRDPHLAAIGFIFTPLTALAQLPMQALSPLWPVIGERAFSGTLMSSVFMAGAVVQILGIGLDRGLPRGYALAITAIFALNPMIVLYGANGMSEAPFIFFMTWAVRRLIRWMVDDDVHHLIVAGGIAMGLAYLTRYDAVACIAAAGLLVGVATYRRARTPPRLRRALLDVVMASGPGTVAFVGWVGVSWLITGEGFAQFTSQYGNTAILAQSGQESTTFGAGLAFAVVCISLLAPTLVPIAGWAVVRRWGRPNWQVLLVPLAIYGAALAFQTLSYAAGSTFPFLRFYVIAVPLAACLAMLAVPDGVLVAAKRPGRHAPPPAPVEPVPRTRAPYVGVALLLAIGVPTTAWGMTLPDYAPQEYGLAAVVARDATDVTPRGAIERRIAASFSTERRIAEHLERLDLPDSSVITDTVFGFAVLAASKKPKMFVIPSDPDFTALLNDPSLGGIKYLLAVPPEGRGVSDALNLRYPTLYETGAEIATLELEIPNDGDSLPDWRLYRVLEPPPS